MNHGVDYSQLPLRDIHLPPAVSWWPPAPGWWLLAVMFIAGGIFVAWRYQRRRKRRTTLRSIRNVKAALESGEAPGLCVQRLSVLLRRYAMTVKNADTTRVAGLVGEAWLAYLDQRWTARTFGSVGALLIAAPYAPTGAVSREQADQLAQLCGEWVRAQPV